MSEELVSGPEDEVWDPKKPGTRRACKERRFVDGMPRVISIVAILGNARLKWTPIPACRTFR
jgi:hypothetical protein